MFPLSPNMIDGYYPWLILFCMKAGYQNDWISNIEHDR